MLPLVDGHLALPSLLFGCLDATFVHQTMAVATLSHARPADHLPSIAQDNRAPLPCEKSVVKMLEYMCAAYALSSTRALEPSTRTSSVMNLIRTDTTLDLTRREGTIIKCVHSEVVWCHADTSAHSITDSQNHSATRPLAPYAAH